MQIRKGKPPRSGHLAGVGVELSRAARVRLAWMDFYRGTQNVALTCRHFGISRQTFYRWQRRYDPYDLTTLEARSHRPHRQRQPTWSFLFEDKVLRLRLQFPRWGKDKLALLLRRQQLPVPLPWSAAFSSISNGMAGGSNRRAAGFQDRVGLCAPGPMPCANPSTTPCLSPAT